MIQDGNHCFRKDSGTQLDNYVTKGYIHVLMTYKCANQKVTIRIFGKSETKSRTKEEDKLYSEKMNYKSIHIQLIQTTCVVQRKKKS